MTKLAVSLKSTGPLGLGMPGCFWAWAKLLDNAPKEIRTKATNRTEIKFVMVNLIKIKRLAVRLSPQTASHTKSIVEKSI